MLGDQDRDVSCIIREEIMDPKTLRRFPPATTAGIGARQDSEYEQGVWLFLGMRALAVAVAVLPGLCQSRAAMQMPAGKRCCTPRDWLNAVSRSSIS